MDTLYKVYGKYGIAFDLTAKTIKRVVDLEDPTRNVLLQDFNINDLINIINLYGILPEVNINKIKKTYLPDVLRTELAKLIPDPVVSKVSNDTVIEAILMMCHHRYKYGTIPQEYFDKEGAASKSLIYSRVTNWGYKKSSAFTNMWEIITKTILRYGNLDYSKAGYLKAYFGTRQSYGRELLQKFDDNPHPKNTLGYHVHCISCIIHDPLVKDVLNTLIKKYGANSLVKSYHDAYDDRSSYESACIVKFLDLAEGVDNQQEIEKFFSPVNEAIIKEPK
jgi:hypothetical protein